MFGQYVRGARSHQRHRGTFTAACREYNDRNFQVAVLQVLQRLQSIQARRLIVAKENLRLVFERCMSTHRSRLRTEQRIQRFDKPPAEQRIIGNNQRSQ